VTPPTHRVTALLVDWSRGDRGALDRLVPLVYRELCRIAGHELGRERRDHTLDAGALVHEAFMRLVDQRQVQWTDRAHFFAVAAHLMRRILVDYARRHRAVKRGGGAEAVSLSQAASAAMVEPLPVASLNAALDRLAGLDAAQARIVELRAFGGLTIDETAHVLGVSPATVSRAWRMARAWLYRELYGE
jgi:RNA polymerase sigma factor (TIGR02999 family)